jgi:BirA family transcriptional regulator, biotin operon repressor / biotin---[acetyl-CoA-carboxylase] ligase
MRCLPPAPVADSSKVSVRAVGFKTLPVPPAPFLRGCGLRGVLHLGRASSTQVLARALAEAGAPAGTLVWADRQTRGKGRMGSRWSSGNGGLFFSLILRPDMTPTGLAAFSRKTADICASALAKATGLKMRVKPPNDIFAWGEPGMGGKVCGILIEASGGLKRVDWIVLGIGVNVNNRLPRALTQAASLRCLAGRCFEVPGVLRNLLRALHAYLT